MDDFWSLSETAMYYWSLIVGLHLSLQSMVSKAGLRLILASAICLKLIRVRPVSEIGLQN